MGKVNQPPPRPRTPLRNKGLIAGLIKGNQWLISPDHKALFVGGGTWPGGGLVDLPLQKGGKREGLGGILAVIQRVFCHLGWRAF